MASLHFAVNTWFLDLGSSTITHCPCYNDLCFLFSAKSHANYSGKCTTDLTFCASYTFVKRIMHVCVRVWVGVRMHVCVWSMGSLHNDETTICNLIRGNGEWNVYCKRSLHVISKTKQTIFFCYLYVKLWASCVQSVTADTGAMLDWTAGLIEWKEASVMLTVCQNQISGS